MLNSTQDVVHPLPAKRVFIVATIVDPMIEDPYTACVVVKHRSPFVAIQVIHALSKMKSQLPPLGANTVYDPQISELSNAGCLCGGRMDPLMISIQHIMC